MLPSTLQLLIVMIGCSINERMQKALDYKSEEVVILKEILREVTKKKRIDFKEEKRARLAPTHVAKSWPGSPATTRIWTPR